MLFHAAKLEISGVVIKVHLKTILSHILRLPYCIAVVRPGSVRANLILAFRKLGGAIHDAGVAGNLLGLLDDAFRSEDFECAYHRLGQTTRVERRVSDDGDRLEANCRFEPVRPVPRLALLEELEFNVAWK